MSAADARTTAARLGIDGAQIRLLQAHGGDPVAHNPRWMLSDNGPVVLPS